MTFRWHCHPSGAPSPSDADGLEHHGSATRLARLYVPVGTLLHTGIYFTMGAPFFQFIALYVVFLPVLMGH